ncbi:copper chaperone PCu(A)C [Dongia sp.]|uniref:copper chaperone PCu(A)C n=1 Tax=Dongia sp. TaxID=1977262 RepID=UPI0035B187A7
MKKLLTFLLAALISLGGFTTLASAHEQKAGDLVLEHAWSRATPGGAKTGAVFVKIENHGDTADQLLSASSEIAAMTEVHQMSMENDMMTMKPAGVLDIPAHGELVLKPHSYHVMLMGLKKPLIEGDTFIVTLEFAKAGKVDLQVVVGKVDDMGEEH